MNYFLKFLLLGISFFAFTSSINAEEITEVDSNTGIEWVLLDEKTVNIYDLIEANKSLNNDSLITPFSLPHYEHTFGGSLSNPARIHTDRVWIRDINGYSTPFSIEYSIINNQLVLFENEGYDYYTQGWTQGYINGVTGALTQIATSGLIARFTYQISGKIPYLTKVSNTNKQVIQQFGSYVTGGTAMVALSSPIFGKITYSGVPSIGTKELIVYTKRESASTWDYRARFVISGQTLSINTWVAK